MPNLIGTLQTIFIVCFEASMLDRMQSWSGVSGHVLTRKHTSKRLNHAVIDHMFVDDGSSTWLSHLKWRFCIVHGYCVNQGVFENAVQKLSQVLFGKSRIDRFHSTQNMTCGPRHLLRKESKEVTSDMIRGLFRAICIFCLNPWIAKRR